MKGKNRRSRLKKQIIAIVVCFTLGLNVSGTIPVVNATGMPAGTSTEENLNIDPNGTLGRNSDIGIKVDKSIIATAGETVSLEFTISAANSKAKIKDIFPVVDDTFPFETSNDAYKVVSAGNDTDKQKKLSVKYDFVAQVNIESGYHTVRYVVEYLKDTGSGEEEFYVIKTIRVYFSEMDEEDSTGTPGTTPNEDSTASDENTALPDGNIGTDGGSGNRATPKLIITGYETSPKKVMAGDEFTITIHVQNTSKTTGIKNAKFLIGNEAGSVLPTSGSSSIYVEKIGAGETGDLTIGMKTASDLPQKSYVITVKGDFEDSSNTSFSYTENLYLPIYQEIKLGITDVSLSPETIGINETGTLMFTINNQGKAGVYNASVNIKGDVVMAEESYVGNIAASSSAYASIDITGVQDNSDTGKITAVITYEDADGTSYEMEQEVDCYISESAMNTGDEMVEMEFEEPSGPSIGLIIVMILIVLVIIGIIVTVVVLRIKKKKAMLEEEDDLEDEDL